MDRKRSVQLNRFPTATQLRAVLHFRVARLGLIEQYEIHGVYKSRAGAVMTLQAGLRSGRMKLCR
jgi:hypothetical protein